MGAYLRRLSSGNDLTVNGWDEVCEADGSFEYSGLSTERLFYNLQASAAGLSRSGRAGGCGQPRDCCGTDDPIGKDSVPAFHLAVAAKAIASAASAKSQTPTTTLPHRAVRGFVRDENGHRIAGAKVRWAGDLWDSAFKPTMTNAEGKYRLPEVPAGRGALLVIADSYAPQLVPVRAKQENLDVQLSRGTSFRGTVNSRSGSPVAGVRVIPVMRCQETGICNPIWLDDRSTQTNEKGEFKIAALPRKGVRFDFLKEGYADRRDVELFTDDFPGRDAPNNIYFMAVDAISGTVIDLQDGPVRNFKIRVMIPRNYKGRGRSVATTRATTGTASATPTAMVFSTLAACAARR